MVLLFGRHSEADVLGPRSHKSAVYPILPTSVRLDVSSFEYLIKKTYVINRKIRIIRTG